MPFFFNFSTKYYIKISLFKISGTNWTLLPVYRCSEEHKFDPMRLNWQPKRTTCCSQGKKCLTDSYHLVKRKHKHSYSPLTAVLIRGANRVRQMLFSQAVWVMVPSCPDKVGLMGRMFHREKNTGRAEDYCVIIPNSSQMKMTVWRVEDTPQTQRPCSGYSQHTHCSNTVWPRIFTVGEEKQRKFVWAICLVVLL